MISQRRESAINTVHIPILSALNRKLQFYKTFTAERSMHSSQTLYEKDNNSSLLFVSAGEVGIELHHHGDFSLVSHSSFKKKTSHSSSKKTSKSKLLGGDFPLAPHSFSKETSKSKLLGDGCCNFNKTFERYQLRSFEISDYWYLYRCHFDEIVSSGRDQ
jgi:hypothetical protein